MWEQAFVDSRRTALVRLYRDQWPDDQVKRLVEAADLIPSDALYDMPKDDSAECVDLRAVGLPGRLLVLVVEIMVGLVFVILAVKALTGAFS